MIPHPRFITSIASISVFAIAAHPQGTTFPGNVILSSNTPSLLLQDTVSGGKTYSLSSQWGGYFTIFDESTPGEARLSILSNGGVGIGKTVPSGPLEVRAIGEDSLVVYGPHNNAVALQTLLDGAGWGEYATGYGGAENRLLLQPIVGNVGIGTTNPTHKLAVNGTIKAKEVIVEITGWSDYVFADDYTLAPLAEVEAHIKEHKHLPGIPSAAQVAEQGVSVGDMQAKLLAKIEELTLHQIAQEKRALAQEARAAEQDKELTALRAQVSQLSASRP